MKQGIRVLEFLLVLGFALGGCVALTWWYLMPGGFPISHPRFWVNSVLPLLAVATCTSGAIAIVRQQHRVLKCIFWLFGTVVIVSGIAGLCLFPKSIHGTLLVVVVITVIVAILVLGVSLWALKKTIVSVGAVSLVVFAGLIIGILFPWSQRALDPATRPYRQEGLIPTSGFVKSEGQIISLTDKVSISPVYGELGMEFDGISLNVHPLLTFDSRSPDRCWTIFSPVKDHYGPDRLLRGVSRSANGITLDYKDDGYTRLKVGKTEADGSIDIEASSFLPHDIYSHLNSYCEIQISSPGDLALSFSPCPGKVEMKEFEHPVGKPVRLAYLDLGNVFHVVEANSGEKGPFTGLSEGVIKADEPLQITIYSNKEPKYRITLYDWASQASRQLSPAAGWGLPENAIEFSCFYGNRSNEGVIFFTLAATSTGRGWDSVGHAAGTYRNRMKIEVISSAETHARHFNRPEGPTMR